MFSVEFSIRNLEHITQLKLKVHLNLFGYGSKVSVSIGIGGGGLNDLFLLPSQHYPDLCERGTDFRHLVLQGVDAGHEGKSGEMWGV